MSRSPVIAAQQEKGQGAGKVTEGAFRRKQRHAGFLVAFHAASGTVQAIF